MSDPDPFAAELYAYSHALPVLAVCALAMFRRNFMVPNDGTDHDMALSDMREGLECRGSYHRRVCGTRLYFTSLIDPPNSPAISMRSWMPHQRTQKMSSWSLMASGIPKMADMHQQRGKVRILLQRNIQHHSSNGLQLL